MSILQFVILSLASYEEQTELRLGGCEQIIQEASGVVAQETDYGSWDQGTNGPKRRQMDKFKKIFVSKFDHIR